MSQVPRENKYVLSAVSLRGTIFATPGEVEIFHFISPAFCYYQDLTLLPLFAYAVHADSARLKVPPAY